VREPVSGAVIAEAEEAQQGASQVLLHEARLGPRDIPLTRPIKDAIGEPIEVSK
jgi:hypothetical protein